MADLMSGTYSMPKLIQKYKNFFLPAVKILVAGTDLVSSMKLAVESLNVVLSTQEAASASFNIVNAYQRDHSGFDSKVISKLMLGSSIEVLMGYGSSFTGVFKGYISEISMEFSDVPTLSVTAMDARRLMMESGDTFIIHDVTKYSDAFSAVMARYQKLVPKKVVEADTGEPLEGISQTLNDYQFITQELCRSADKEFFLLYDTAYFRTAGKEKRPITTLTWGKDLISFSRSVRYQDITVQVIGLDDENKKSVEAKVTPKSSERQTKAIAEMQSTLLSKPNIKDIEAAKKVAKKEAEERQEKSREGQAVCIGLPELVPGRYVALEALDKSLNKKYYIRRVTHSFGGDGFTTSLELGGGES